MAASNYSPFANIQMPTTSKVIFHASLSSADFFQNQHFRKILSGISIVSNSFDPDQAQLFVRPDLGPNCLQIISRPH